MVIGKLPFRMQHYGMHGIIYHLSIVINYLNTIMAVFGKHTQYPQVFMEWLILMLAFKGICLVKEIIQVQQLHQFFNVSLTPDYNTFKCLLTLLNSYEVDFTVSNLYLLLGFKSQIYTTTQEGPNNVNISNGIDKVLIHVDCVTGSYTLGQSSDVLYSFAPNSSPSSLLIVDPIKRVYLPLNQSSYLNKIRVRITDDSNNRLNLNGEQVTVTLLLKPMKR